MEVPRIKKTKERHGVKGIGREGDIIHAEWMVCVSSSYVYFVFVFFFFWCVRHLKRLDALLPKINKEERRRRGGVEERLMRR